MCLEVVLLLQKSVHWEVQCIQKGLIFVGNMNLSALTPDNHKDKLLNYMHLLGNGIM